MSRLFAPLRIITSILMFWAIAKHSSNYYVLLRWLVFLVAAWGAYRSYQELHEKWFMVCFHLALMILFNPFLLITFDKTEWNVVDGLAGFMLLISIFIVDSEGTDEFFKTIVGQVLSVSVVGGLSVAWIGGAFLVGLMLIHISVDQGLNDLRLWLGGNYIRAQITRVHHDVEQLENDRGKVGYKDVYEIDYSFESDGRVYYGKASLDESPIDLEGQEEIIPSQSELLEIEYERNNPSNNRALSSSSKLQHLFPGLLFLALGLGAVFWSLKTIWTLTVKMRSKEN